MAVKDLYNISTPAGNKGGVTSYWGPWVFAFWLMVFACGAHSFESRGYGEFGGEFLKLPRGAMSAGLGNSVTAWQGDLAGLQFNPALLAGLAGYHVTGTYTYLSLDRKNNALDAAFPLGRRFTGSFSLGHYGVGGIPEAIAEDDGSGGEVGRLTGKSFDDNEFSVETALAGEVLKGFKAGIRGRYIYQKIGDYAEGMAHGMGFDIGLFRQVGERVSFGASLLNLGSLLWWESGRTDQVVPVVRTGMLLEPFKDLLHIEADVIQPWSQPVEGSLGAQVSVFEILKIRTGIKSAVVFREGNFEGQAPSLFFGLGIRYRHFGLDYAAMDPGSPFGLGHKFSLLFEFSGSAKN